MCQTTAAGEDYVDFGTMEGFMAPGGVTGGWHIFRGKGWEDKMGDLAISLSPSAVQAWYYQGAFLWDTVTYSTTVQLDRWCTICFQHDTAAQRATSPTPTSSSSEARMWIPARVKAI